MKTNWYSMVSLIQAQRNDPQPIEYIIGGSFFCGEWFIVTPDVLIPRIETEALIQVSSLPATAPNVQAPTGQASSYGAGQSQVSSEDIRVLDLGTGCGNIAITLAKRLNCKVYAVDISEEALSVAKRNAKLHGVEDLIEFYKSDWYSELDIEPVDIIVSNPPYIKEKDWDSLPSDVKDYEPRIALWGGRDGLMHYKEIISGAKKFLVPDGRIVMEIGYNQAEDVKNLLGGFEEIEIIKDQFGNPRVINAKKLWIN